MPSLVSTSVLSVRDPSEVILPVNPFDSTEAQQCVVNSVNHTNISFPHVPMPQAQFQPLFNVQGYNAASVINAANVNYPWRTPMLIHCSSGDRASAAFAVFLIAYHGYTNAQAAQYATQNLALAVFAPFVQNYSKP